MAAPGGRGLLFIKALLGRSSALRFGSGSGRSNRQSRVRRRLVGCGDGSRTGCPVRVRDAAADGPPGAEPCASGEQRGGRRPSVEASAAGEFCTPRRWQHHPGWQLVAAAARLTISARSLVIWFQAYVEVPVGLAMTNLLASRPQGRPGPKADSPSETPSIPSGQVGRHSVSPTGGVSVIRSPLHSGPAG
jgi:hypothetical protein